MTFKPLNSYISLNEQRRLYAFLTPLHVLSGHIGMLVFQAPPIKGLLLDKPARVALVLWALTWLGLLFHSRTHGPMASPGVRLESILWLFGVIAMPLALGIGAAIQHHEDLRSNRLHELEKDLLQALHTLENGVEEINSSILHICRTEIDQPAILTKLRQAVTEPDSGEELLRHFLGVFRKNRIPLNGMRISARQKILAEKFTSTLPFFTLQFIKTGLQEAWLNYQKTLQPENDRNGPKQAATEGFNADFLSHYRGKAFTMAGSDETPNSIKAGDRKLFLFRQVLGDKKKPEFLVSTFWSLEKMVDSYLESALSNPRLLNGKPDISLAAFRIKPTAIEEVGVTSGDLAAQPDIQKIAETARQHPVRRLRTNRDDLIISWKSEKIPGFILLGRASLEKAREEINREMLRSLGLILGLTILILAVARLLAARLAEPVIRMTRGLQEVSGGNLQARVAENRADELGQAGLTLDQMTQWLDERKRMSRFVSAQVMDIVAAGNYREAMAGTQRDVVILISDIRSFTTLSESHSPQDIFSMLNHHMGQMTRAIQREGGVIDRFIGDAIQAVFYANASDSQLAAIRAIRAAIAMKQAHLTIRHERQIRQEFTYEIGIGIDSGNVIAGVMGDQHSRLDFTVIGEPLQLAGEYEASSKDGSHSRIIVSPAVQREASDLFCFSPLPAPHLGHEISALEMKHPAGPGSGFNAKPSEEVPVESTFDNPLPVPKTGIHQQAAYKRSSTQERLDSFGGVLAIFFLLFLPPFMITASTRWFQESRVHQLQTSAREELDSVFRQAENTANPVTQISWFLRQSRRIRHRMTTFFPEASWFIFTPKQNISRFECDQPNSIQSFSPELFRLARVRRHAAFPLSNDEILDFYSFFQGFDVARTTVFDTHWRNYLSLQTAVQLANLANGKKLGEMGMHNLFKKIPESRECLSPITLGGNTYYLFWKPFYRGSPDSPQAKLRSAFLAFLPASAITPEKGTECFLTNLQDRGFPAALVRKIDHRSQCLYSGQFSSLGFLPHVKRGLQGETLSSGPWLLASEKISEAAQTRLFLARKWRKTAKIVQPNSEAGIQTEALGRHISYCWLLLGGIFIILLVVDRIPDFLTLRPLLVAGFAMIVIPTLFLGSVILERNLLERKTRLFSDKKRHLVETLQALDSGPNLFQTYACALMTHQIRLQETLGCLLEREKANDPEGKTLSFNIMLQLYAYCRYMGVTVKSVETSHSSGFSMGYGSTKTLLDCFRIIHSKNMSFLNPGVNQSSAPKSKDLYIGTQVEDLMHIMETLLPPDTFASWLLAPQALISFQTPWEGKTLILTQNIMEQGLPRWLIQFTWTQEPVFRQVLSDWHQLTSAIASTGLEVGTSQISMPCWGLVPPFWQEVSQWGDKNRPEYHRDYPVISLLNPKIADFSLQCADSMKEIDGLRGNEKTGRLVVAIPGNETPNMVFHASIPIREIIGEALQQAGQKRGLLFLLAVIALFLAVGVANRFLRPLIELSRAARHIMRKNFEVRLAEAGNSEFAQLGKAFNEMVAGVQQGKLLSQFVSESVQAAARDHSREQAARAGENLQMTIAFISLGEFKSRMKKTPPDLLVRQLNLFLEQAAAIIRKHGGEVDKFIGEKVLAVFNPRSLGTLEQSQIAAVTAAEELQAALPQLSFWQGHQLGIGLVSGPVLAGILGTQDVRLEYTVIGDTVNLASRLCDLALREGGGTVVEGTSLDPAQTNKQQGLWQSFQALGEISVKGKTKKISCLISRPQKGSASLY